MSISSALANALSGLSASSRAAQLVSSNVANATTEGYARRDLQLSARTTATGGDGVQVDGINRFVDQALLTDRRLAEAGRAESQVTTDYYTSAADIIGRPGEPGSLSDRIAAFDSALIEAASRPDSTARLAAVADAAVALTDTFGAASDGIQTLRERADQGIAADVAELNADLARVADLNASILRARGSGRDYPALLDQRQVVIDRISTIVPVSQIQRENDTVALYTLGGTRLVDLTAAELTFTPSSPITPDQTLASGALSGLSIDGTDLRLSGANSAIAGGTLAAQFNIRDALAPELQAEVDALAADLVRRFETPGLDPTSAPGVAGLFTDAGNPLDPAMIENLSGRLQVNSAVLPAEGGQLWRLRDGLGAVAAGPAGDTALLSAMRGALASADLPGSPLLGSAARDLSGFVADRLSELTQGKLASESALAFETSRFESLKNRELQNGVDTDQELQKLLLIEQAYAANAQVIRTASRLIDQLLEIT